MTDKLKRLEELKAKYYLHDPMSESDVEVLVEHINSLEKKLEIAKAALKKCAAFLSPSAQEALARIEE